MQKKQRITKLTEQTIKSDLNLENLFQNFYELKKVQGMSERTLEDYRKTFSKFFKLPKVTNELKLKEIILRFFEPLSHKAPATYNVPYSNLNTFFNWCVEQEYIKKNPLKVLGLKKKKDEGRARHIEEDIIKKLLDSIDLTTYAGLRDYSLILLTLDTGIRPKEAFGLTIDDIDLSYNKITIRKEVAKTRTSRILPITPQTSQILKRLISFKLEYWVNYVFLTNEGGQMNIVRWDRRLRDYSERIKSKITPYDLRHSFAIMFLRNNGNLFALQQTMGHTDLEMTKRYVKLASNDLQTQHTLASPVNNFLKRTTRVQKLFKTPPK